MVDKISFTPTFFLAAFFALAPLFAAGCEKHVVHDEPMIAPNQNMSKLKGDDMPPAMGAPMPSGWKGFKPY